MAYSASGLRCVLPGVGGGPSLFVYTSADIHTDVDATGYFATGKANGMKVGDIVQVVVTPAYTVTTHAVSAVSAAGAATISAAVLA